MKTIFLFQDGFVQIFERFFIEVHIAPLLVLVLIATAFDLKERRIPNWLVLSGSLIGVSYHTFSAYGIGLFDSAAGFSIGLITFIPLYVFRAMGAGDVKMMAMVGAFLGPASTFGAILTTLLAGGILSIFAAMWGRVLIGTLENARFIVFNALVSAMTRTRIRAEFSSASKIRLPYAVAIATGTVVHLFLLRSGAAFIS